MRFTGKMQAPIQREIWDGTEYDGKGINVGVCSLRVRSPHRCLSIPEPHGVQLSHLKNGKSHFSFEEL